LTEVDGIHDMGGMAGFGPIDIDAVEPGHEGWEARNQVVALLSGGMSRAGIEEIPPEQYLNATYAERWVLCAERRLVANGVLSADDLASWAARLETAPGTEMPRTEMPHTEQPEALGDLERMVTTTTPMPAPPSTRFAIGDRVRVKRMHPTEHNRCPRYVRGTVGEIERIPGADHRPGAPRTDEMFEAVYTVKFDSVDLWGEQDEPAFDLFIDLCQGYLEAP
jgi:nitrile hydratase